MISKLKSQSSISDPDKSNNPVPRLDKDKAKAYHIFINSYPASTYIDSQKELLKSKYANARARGVQASELKKIIEEIKGGDRDLLVEKVKEYKGVMEILRRDKSEIEHLQHLLEQARIRMVRDFEGWYESVYCTEGVEDSDVDSAGGFVDHESDGNVDDAEGEKRLESAFERVDPVQIIPSKTVDRQKTNYGILGFNVDTAKHFKPEANTNNAIVSRLSASTSQLRKDVEAFYKARDKILKIF